MLYCAITGFLSFICSIDPEFQWTVNDCSCMIDFTMLEINIQEYILVWVISLKSLLGSDEYCHMIKYKACVCYNVWAYWQREYIGWHTGQWSTS